MSMMCNKQDTGKVPTYHVSTGTSTHPQRGCLLDPVVVDRWHVIGRSMPHHASSFEIDRYSKALKLAVAILPFALGRGSFYGVPMLD